MSTTYQPDNVPGPNAAEFRGWLQKEFQAIKRAWEAAKPNEKLQILRAEPSRVEAGMVVNADGTNWDPGSGAGLYLRSEDNTEWTFLGAADTEVDTTEFVTEDELDKLTVIAIAQLRQLTKIQLLLSNMSGVVIDDSEINAPTYQLRELTKISLILSVMTGTVIADSETDLTNF